jgi:hypothetical protein
MIWLCKYLVLEREIRTYKSAVKPILMYSGETRADASITRKQNLRKTVRRTSPIILTIRMLESNNDSKKQENILENGERISILTYQD